ncbi:MAG TPA: HIT family protein [Streptosporangiaceae bacterium]
MMAAGCVFCERVAGRDFWFAVGETRHSIAAVANHQRSTGSLIVIPRRHVLALHELSDEEALDLFRITRAATLAVERAYRPDAMYVWQGGRIPLAHIHVRICPRYQAVPYTFEANGKLPLTPMAERERIARRVSAELSHEPQPSGRTPYTFRGQDPCPVCEHLDADRGDRWPEVARSASSVALVPSRQPTAGTTLVVPSRHVLAPGDLPEAEAADLWLLLRAMTGASMRAFGPPSYHVSQYVGALTGEPLDHLSWRLEPRYQRPPEEDVAVWSLAAVPVPERRRLAGLLRAAWPPPAPEVQEAQEAQDQPLPP